MYMCINYVHVYVHYNAHVHKYLIFYLHIKHTVYWQVRKKINDEHHIYEYHI